MQFLFAEKNSNNSTGKTVCKHNQLKLSGPCLNNIFCMQVFKASCLERGLYKSKMFILTLCHY